MSRKTLLIAFGGLLLAGALAYLLVPRESSDPRFFREDYLHCVVKGDMRYDFDASWRGETLSRRGEDGVWRSVALPRDEDLAPWRALLLGHLRLKTVEEIPEEGESEKASLKALGY